MGGAGGEALPRKFSPPWKNVLDIIKNIRHSSKILGPLSENSSPLLVSQAGYGPAKG